MTLRKNQIDDINMIIQLLEKSKRDLDYGDCQKDLELAKRGLTFIEIDQKDFKN